MISASTAPNAPNSVGSRSRAATTVSTYATTLAMLVAAATPPAVATRAVSCVPRFCFTVASASTVHGLGGQCGRYVLRPACEVAQLVATSGLVPRPCGAHPGAAGTAGL